MIRYTGDLDHILQAGATQSAGVDVDHVDAAAIRSHIDVIADQLQFPSRFTGCQPVGRRGKPEGFLNEVTGRLDDHCVPIH